MPALYIDYNAKIHGHIYLCFYLCLQNRKVEIIFIFLSSAQKQSTKTSRRITTNNTHSEVISNKSAHELKNNQFHVWYYLMPTVTL